MSPALDLLTTITAIGVALASVAVNVKAWRKRPPSVRSGLYLWAAFVSFTFAVVYGLVLFRVVDLSVLVDLLIFRMLTILLLLGMLLHGYVDT